MSLRTSLQKLIRRDPVAPTLRERAAELRGSLSRSATSPVEAPAPNHAKPATAELPKTADTELVALLPAWEAARDAYTEASRRCCAVSVAADEIEPPPSRDLPHEEWLRLVEGWRERTGVEDAEGDVNEALDALAAIEDRIAALPAASLAGLRLKALVAQRCDGIDIKRPDGFDEGLTRDLLAIADGSLDMALPEDAELIRLGAQFDVARAREIAANEACNAAEDEADRHMPERPACLIYRACDARLMVHATMMMGEALDGREVRESDIAWLKRKMPMHHQVLRPIRDGERAHIDHPGSKFDIVPHVEAQARAEEIVAAWDAWQAEQLRVHGEYVTDALDDAANAAGDATAALAGRIAALPARSPEGFRVKLRALAHYNSSFFYSTLPDLPDPDQALSHSLWRDAQDDLPASAGIVAGAASEDLSKAPATAENWAGIAFEAYSFDTPLRTPAEWIAAFSQQALGMHIADKTLRMTKPELTAFILNAAKRENGVDEAMHTAMDCAQSTFEGWGRLLETASARYFVAALAGQEAAETEAGSDPA